MNADILVSEAISRSMTRSLENAATTVGRDRTSAIMHDVQDYHISPEGFLTRRLFSNGVSKIRQGEWTIADDGSLYTLPLGTDKIHIGRM